MKKNNREDFLRFKRELKTAGICLNRIKFIFNEDEDITEILIPRYDMIEIAKRLIKTDKDVYNEKV
jgi:hypothetical protein